MTLRSELHNVLHPNAYIKPCLDFMRTHGEGVEKVLEALDKSFIAFREERDEGGMGINPFVLYREVMNLWEEVRGGKTDVGHR